jgi:hypothetical protein
MDVGRVHRMEGIHFGVSTQVVPAPISSPTQLVPRLAPMPRFGVSIQPLMTPQVRYNA